MAFWGVEVKPGKPYTHRYDNERGRLHLSQATLGNGSSTKRSIVQCNVGDTKPIFLCSLLPEKLETCQLNLEFEEDEEVTFSVVGPHSIHLSGFFYGEAQDSSEDDYELDPYAEDIVGTESESDDYDTEDEDEDDYTDDDLGSFPPSPIPNSGVKIEEILDDEKTANENGTAKRMKKKKNQSNGSDQSENTDQRIVAKNGNAISVLESEDEDGFPISSTTKTKADAVNPNSASGGTRDERTVDKPARKEAKDDNHKSKNLKRKMDTLVQDGEQASKTTPVPKSSDRANNAVPENDEKEKGKGKKKKVSNTEEKDVNYTPVVENENSQNPTIEKEKEKKKKKKKNKKQEIAANTGTGQSTAGKDKSIETEEMTDRKPLQVRSFPNGLVIEELAMGKPAGKRASPGKKVSVHYMGKLKKNGKIFDSNIGRAPFRFRLGVGQVIKGWDVGVNGMRVGDKRRLTIPPAMGYGSQGAGGAIPPNSWLVFDVELVEVN